MSTEILELALSEATDFGGPDSAVFVSLDDSEASKTKFPRQLIFLRKDDDPIDAAANLEVHVARLTSSPALVVLFGDWPDSYGAADRQLVLQTLLNITPDDGTLLRIHRPDFPQDKASSSDIEALSSKIAPGFEAHDAKFVNGHLLYQIAGTGGDEQTSAESRDLSCADIQRESRQLLPAAQISELQKANASLKDNLESAQKKLARLESVLGEGERHQSRLQRDLNDALSQIEALQQNTSGQNEREAALTGRPFKTRDLPNLDNRRLKVAGIMDEFTTACYVPECDYLPLSPDNWYDELVEFRPDLIFVESAWHGNGGLWHLKVSTASTELEDILRWGKAAGVPSVFWNKEDPVHFSSFLDVAGQCDVVFTTDMDCIPEYKKALGHGRVYLLPFAAQPKIHNPIEELPRKDAFNFAGSYYLRYPERQRDIATLIDAVKDLRPVEIYDRNHERDHPHYQFPRAYQSQILGSLPFSDIHKAYKGYAYGINMNTIKQSQSMFARRVYELMASNTVVVSNFSRGVRLLFGDLVICSDEGRQISQSLEILANNPEHYRKFRLLGLRKVMSEHTYGARLSYILKKVFREAPNHSDPNVAIIAVAKSEEQRRRLLVNWNRQLYKQARLFILTEGLSPAEALPGSVYEKNDARTLITAIEEYGPSLVGGFVADDYYGQNYLTDLSLALRYTNANGWGKNSLFEAGPGTTLTLKNEGKTYLPTDVLLWRSGVFSYCDLTPGYLRQFFANPESAHVRKSGLIALDEFNYCRNGAQLDPSIRSRTDDLTVNRSGVAIEAMTEFAESLEIGGLPRALSTESLPSLGPDHYSSYLKSSAKDGIRFGKTKTEFVVFSDLSAGQHRYLWMKQKFSRADINFVDDSTINFMMVHSTEQAHVVVEFLDADDQKLSHTMLPKGGSHALAIPNDCMKLRLGLRVMGPGEMRLGPMHFGMPRPLPAVVLGSSDTLILCKDYPTYRNPHRFQHLHDRVLGYRRLGQNVEIFRLNTAVARVYEEYEGTDILSGDLELLDATLAKGGYRHVMIHELDRESWQVVSKYLNQRMMTIWIGNDCLQGAASGSDASTGHDASADLAGFYKELLLSDARNIRFVFTSNFAKRSIEAAAGVSVANQSYSIIRPHIDLTTFTHREKAIAHRKKVFAIGALDAADQCGSLTVAAILELAKRPVFQALSFYLVGEGELFETMTAPLQNLGNVTCQKGPLSRLETAALHKRFGIFLGPLRRAGATLHLQEAMASGLVPITTKTGAVPEVVDRGSGVLVPPGDHVALADAIERLYNQPREFIRRSKGAAERVRRQDDFDQRICWEISRLEGAEFR